MQEQKNNFKVIADRKNARMLLPNMLTLFGVCIGLTSIRFALDGKFEFAIIAIIFAALIDGLDGRIARLIKGTSKVGKELDSLTDMISFGVAPAFIMYFWKLNELGKFGWLLCLIYVICVALRLARFNINSGWKYKPELFDKIKISSAETVSNTHSLGQILYTDYIHVFQISGMILLVAMIGAIVLTFRQREGVKRQDYIKQISSSRNNRRPK